MQDQLLKPLLGIDVLVGRRKQFHPPGSPSHQAVAANRPRMKNHRNRTGTVMKGGSPNVIYLREERRHLACFGLEICGIDELEIGRYNLPPSQ